MAVELTTMAASQASGEAARPEALAQPSGASPRPSSRTTTVLALGFAVTFLAMHVGTLLMAHFSGNADLMQQAFAQINSGSTTVLSVLAALLIPSPVQR